jgi:protein SCO1/2
VAPDWRAAALAAALLFAGVPAARAADPDLADAPRIAGHFTLTAPDGRDLTERSFPGQWLLIYFGYTFCPDACPTALSAISEALDEIGPLADRFQPIFITVDPERDTPPVLADYVKAFHPRLIGLGGSAPQVAAAARDFHVFYQVRQLGNDEYAIDHSSYIYVVDPDGKVAELITGNMPGHPVAAELKRLAR